MKTPKLTWQNYQEQVAPNKFMLVADCNEYDITIQAPTLETLEQRKRETIAGHIAICTEWDIEPFACIKKRQ